MKNTLEVIFTWPDGKKEVRYRATKGSSEAKEFYNQVQGLKKPNGYSIIFTDYNL